MLAFTSQRIRSLCGASAFKRGEEYCAYGQVMIVERDDDNRYIEAVVQDEDIYRVEVDIDGADFSATCHCAGFGGYYPYCKHIAGVLIYLLEEEKGGADRLQPRGEVVPIPTPAVSSRDVRLTSGLIELFEQMADSERLKTGQKAASVLKETLAVEWTCKVTDEYQPEPKFRIEMKVGPNRLYVVQNIRQFLLHIEEGRSLPFTKLFTYSPKQHTFRPEDWAVIDMLIRICGSEFAYDEAGRSIPGFAASGSQRMLTIPPLGWNELLPLLVKAGAAMEREYASPQPIQLGEGQIPLSFHVGSIDSGDAYHLEINGLKRVVVMTAYGCAAVDGTIYRLPVRDLLLLSEMKTLIYRYDHKRINISPHQMDALMEKVVPGLRRIGKVGMDASVRDQLVQPDLVAKLYLDRDETELTARLEFVYDGVVIDAFADTDARKDGDFILVRDTDKERRLIEALKGTDFVQNGREMVLDLSEEDSVYDILFHLLPKLEKWVQVYATPAVKQLMHNPNKPPKIKADTDHTTNWLEINFELDHVSDKEIRKLLLSVIEKRKYYRLPGGAYVSLEKEAFQTFGELYDELGMKKGDITGSRIHLPLVKGLQLRDKEGRAYGVQMGKSLRQLIDHMTHPEQMDFDVPEELADVIRDYQRDGFQWLKTLGHYRFGGILADDMGLGKTLQSIAYIVSERREKEGGHLPVLIVSPASLVYNWENEFQKFAPSVQVHVALGARKERSDSLLRIAAAGAETESPNSLAAQQADVIITSYPSLRKDIRLYREMGFSTLFLDEAQMIKNYATQTAQAVREIRAERRFALTGTPIENAVDELWSIFEAVFPGLFTGQKAFRGLTRGQISRIVQPFILRRLRADVLDELPERIETVQRSELSLEQKKLYAAYLEEFKEETIRDLEMEGFQKSRMKILAGITRLRQLCCHPSLFVDGYEGPAGKLSQLLDVVDECLSSGRRILIFSQFTSMLRIIRSELGERGIPVFYLDGQTPAKERVDTCSRFNQGENDVFLISLKAGGTGLNLTGADTVILYDLWWNPAVEEQAAGRAHRMGQKNVVQVIRLVTKGTVEEKMLELQQRKKDLIREVMESADDAVTTLTEQEIRELLAL